MPLFTNRSQAGRMLAKRLGYLKEQRNTLVFAIPRGGVPIGYEVAKYLNLPLDVLMVRKLGVPGKEEFAMGAVASGGTKILCLDVVYSMGVTALELARVVCQEEEELRRGEIVYRESKPCADVQSKSIILVDDGLATGATVMTAIRALRRYNPRQITVAVPLAKHSTYLQLCNEADDVVCLYTPEPFGHVGAWYWRFDPVTDEDVVNFLRRSSDLAESNLVEPSSKILQQSAVV